MASRARNVGLTAGAMWLTAVGAAFGIWSLTAIDTPPALVAVPLALLVTAGILGLGIVTWRSAARAPRDPATVADRTLRRRVGLLVGIECGACFVANGVLSVLGRIDAIPSTNLIIVGLHFLPLARLFRVPRYYALGIAFCIIPTAVLWTLPPEARIGEALARYVAPSLGCGAAAVLAGAFNLWEARQGVRALDRRGS